MSEENKVNVRSPANIKNVEKVEKVDSKKEEILQKLLESIQKISPFTPSYQDRVWDRGRTDTSRSDPKRLIFP